MQEGPEPQLQYVGLTHNEARQYARHRVSVPVTEESGEPTEGISRSWRDGFQTRSFLYIDECVEGTLRLMRSSWTDPVNIGSEEMVSINGLATMISEVAGKSGTLRHIPGPLGVRGRNSDNRLIQKKIGWAPSQSLEQGLRETYGWIEGQSATWRASMGTYGSQTR